MFLPWSNPIFDTCAAYNFHVGIFTQLITYTCSVPDTGADGNFKVGVLEACQYKGEFPGANVNGADDYSNVGSAAISTYPVSNTFRTAKPAVNPTGLVMSLLSVTEATISWTLGGTCTNHGNPTTLAGSWKLLWVLPLALSGTVPTGCTPLVYPGSVTCTATGLSTGTTYKVSLQDVCSVNPETASSAVMESPSYIQESGPVIATNPSNAIAALHSSDYTKNVKVMWAAGSAPCSGPDFRVAGGQTRCVFTSWRILGQENGMWANFTGCNSLTTRGTTECTATNLSVAGATWTFQAQEMCSCPGFESSQTSASNSVQLLTPAAEPIGLLVRRKTFTCPAATLSCSLFSR